MQAVLIKAGMSILGRLVSEAFITEMLLLGLKKLVQSTDNDLDDKIVESVSKALGK